MADDKTATPNAAAGKAPGDDAYHALRRLAGVGYQLRAALRAGDRFLAQDSTDDRDTGSWLISTAVALADDVTAELDGLARGWKPRPHEAGLTQLRTRAHQLHAATRAADHFLEQDNTEDRSTGSWLVACALGLADKLSGETEDLASALKRTAPEGSMPNEAAGVRRPQGAATAARAVV